MSEIKKSEIIKAIEKMNIYEKMLAVQTELQTVAKNLSVSTGKSSYKAVSEKDILDNVKPLEAKYRIYSFPLTRTIVESRDYESESNGYAKLSRYLRICTVYRFVNVDNADEFIDMTTYADGIDSGDKATGKAMTYGDKYALMKAYKISTGEDPDQKGSEEYTLPKISAGRLADLEELIDKAELDKEAMLKYYKVKSLKDLTVTQATQIEKKARENLAKKQEV